MTSTTLASAAAVTGSLAALLWLARRTVRVRVEGPSMEPTFVDGDRLLVLRTSRPRPGQVVVVRDPRDEVTLWVKRVRDVTAEGIDVRGDDPARSTDSRTVGPVPPELLVGRVVRRYAAGGAGLTPPG